MERIRNGANREPTAGKRLPVNVDSMKKEENQTFYYVFPKHIKIMRGLPSASRVQNYIPGIKQVKQGGGHDKPDMLDLSSSLILPRPKILLRM